jgi:hypothetical protein
MTHVLRHFLHWRQGGELNRAGVPSNVQKSFKLLFSEEKRASQRMVSCKFYCDIPAGDAGGYNFTASTACQGDIVLSRVPS